MSPPPVGRGIASNPAATRAVLIAFSVIGAVLGSFCFFGAFVVELINENRFIHESRTLDEGAGSCTAIAPDKVDADNEGKLVYLSGPVTTGETLKDDQLNVTAAALKLTRKVEIYQWVERSESHRTGGRHSTTYYTYHHSQQWVTSPVNSRRFHPDNNTHQRPTNVGKLPLGQRNWYATEARLGAFKLARRQVDKLGQNPLPMAPEMFADVPAQWRDKLTRTPDGILYLPINPGGKPDTPQIGDVRISFAVTEPQTVSLTAAQTGDSFQPWHSSKGGNDIDVLRPGSVSQEEMFKDLESENTGTTWVMRIAGLFCATFGLILLVQPLVALRGDMPVFSGRGCVLTILAALLAPSLLFVAIGLSWAFVRPMNAILPLGAGLAGCVIVLGASIQLLRSRKPTAPPAPEGWLDSNTNP
jgi:hypothetical protein